MTVPVLFSLHPSLTFPFHILPSPVHPTEFTFWFFPGFFAIFFLQKYDGLGRGFRSLNVEIRRSIIGRFLIKMHLFLHFVLGKNSLYSVLKYLLYIRVLNI